LPPKPPGLRACAAGALFLCIYQRRAQSSLIVLVMGRKATLRTTCEPTQKAQSWRLLYAPKAAGSLRPRAACALVQRRPRSRRLGRHGHRSATAAGAAVNDDATAGAADAAGQRQRLAAVDLSLATPLACFQRRPSLAHRFYLSLGAPLYGMRLNNGRSRSCLSYHRCQCQRTFLRVDVRWAPRKIRVGAQHRKLPRCSTCV